MRNVNNNKKREAEMTNSRNSLQIARLHDAFRTYPMFGLVTMKAGISALPFGVQHAIAQLVMTFSNFNSDNDPYGEHDFGAFEPGDIKIFWQIDTYSDHSMMFVADVQPSRPTRWRS